MKKLNLIQQKEALFFRLEKVNGYLRLKKRMKGSGGQTPFRPSLTLAFRSGMIVCLVACFISNSIEVRGDVAISEPFELLDRVVKINSYSHNPDGIREVRDIFVSEFKKLGYSSLDFQLEKNHVLTSLHFSESQPTLLLIGHLDTVFPTTGPTSQTGIEGTRIYGPGIIDMKGGIVVMLKALEALSIDERKKIKILLNDDEELASVYSKEIIAKLSIGISQGLVFEPGLPDGSLVTSAIGGRWIELKISGKSAHAGMEHEKGLNACTELAHKITKLHALTNYSKRVTVNIGNLVGGTQPNVVCEEASTILDVRYVQNEDLNDLLNAIDQIAKESHIRNEYFGISPKASLETLAIVPSMPKSATEVLFGLAKEVGLAMNRQIEGSHVGYGTDGNHLAQFGMQLLVGLGPYGGGLHTHQEFMERDSLQERTEFSRHLIRRILNSGLAQS